MDPVFCAASASSRDRYRTTLPMVFIFLIAVQRYFEDKRLGRSSYAMYVKKLFLSDSRFCKVCLRHTFQLRPSKSVSETHLSIY